MKTILHSALILLAALTVSFHAQARTNHLAAETPEPRNLKCHVTGVQDTSFFEESLSVDEYPEIEIRQDLVVIGASYYGLDDREFLQYRDTSLDGEDQSVTLIHGTAQLKYDMKYVGGLGKLVGQNAGDIEKVIADFVCE